jgi:hypothetical protein
VGEPGGAEARLAEPVALPATAEDRRVGNDAVLEPDLAVIAAPAIVSMSRTTCQPGLSASTRDAVLRACGGSASGSVLAITIANAAPRARDEPRVTVEHPVRARGV